MGSKERIARLKENVHRDILDASMAIVKSEGCDALSIRKIADSIEYTPPVIYSYFLNKEAVLVELAKQGFNKLLGLIRQELPLVTDPKERLEVLLFVYLQFALNENELYQLMYSVGTSVKDVRETFPEQAAFVDLFREQLQWLISERSPSEEKFYCDYLMCISFVHGLVALNRYYKDIDPNMNNMVLKKAIKGIINNIE